MLPRMFRAAGLALALTLGAAMAQGQSLQDNLIAQLQAQGFVEFEVSHTLLGRLRIVAVGPEYRREIVVNPNSGEILRDYITRIDGSTAVPRLMAPGSSGGSAGSSTGSGDRDDSDDDDRNDRDSDNDDRDGGRNDRDDAD